MEMSNQPEGNGRTGRSVALPDENRPSWRPQDEQQRARRALSEEDDRFEDDRYGRIHWEDRERRDWDRDRGGYGHSGYSAGRYHDDRSSGFEGRNQGYPGSFEDRQRERGVDDRYAGRGGSAYYERTYQGTRGYGYSDGDRPGPNLGTGGGMHREHNPSSTGVLHGAPVPTGHRGRGPSNYQRSDERIRELVCEALTEDDRIDPSNVEVSVTSGEVTLSGTVDDRQMKRFAEDVVENVWGVRELQNLIRVTGDKHRAGESERPRHRS
jgi:hypothetical protein